jgi:ATP-dependent Clp protease protease subunit
MMSDPYYDIISKEYKDLLKNRTILLNGDVTENVIERVVIQIQRMSQQSPKTPVTLIINSNGGSLYDSQAVVDAMRTTKTPITTIALGKAMSAGFNIFLAGDLRIVHENSILMCHSGSQTGCESKIADSIDDADFLKRILARFATYYASRTKVPEATWLNLLNSGKDTYFFADDAIRMGIAHEVYQAQATKYLPEPMKQRKVRRSKRRKHKVL